MNPKKLVKLSNIIGIISIILLIYWVFTFTSIQVFGLKVFRKNITETFYMSVLGILALMAGALMINIMFNLTQIAQKQQSNNSKLLKTKKISWLFLMSFPILFLFLLGGDYLTSQKKEKMLIKSANTIIESNQKRNNHFINYKFDEKWIVETSEILQVLSRTDRHFPYISILVKDTLKNEPVFLGFKDYYGNLQDTIQPQKKNFIRQTTQQERDYLNSVFDNNNKEYRYSHYDGKYELFYPYFQGEKKIVIYFSEYQRYGKIGS